MRRTNPSQVMLFCLVLMGVFMASPTTQAEQWQTGATHHGFKLLKIQDVPELTVRGLLFEHQKSGARLLKLECDDDNKVFAVSFLTPPADDTGLPHILEHSVLNGSRKFPVKDPFRILLKGSLKTFLNAFTSSDFTMYPVASTNQKDFRNLMDVYLDAVFHPRLHQDPNILLQEGWRYELEDEKAELAINGIVYNEMKGAYSSPERLLDDALSRNLFPDSPYGKSSGGLPAAMKDLTQEQFRAFHQRLYHPANSYLFLYGDGDTLQELAFIDQEYLKEFSRRPVDAKLPLQKAFKSPGSVVVDYPIAQDEDPANKTYLAMGFVVGGVEDPATSLALSVLCDVLVNLPAAPVRKAMVEAGIGENVYASYDATLQGVLSIVVEKANPDQAERFREVVMATLARVAKVGLDKRDTEGVINRTEFQLREADYGGFPKGLVYGYLGLRNWMFQDDPFLGITYEGPLQHVRTALHSRLLEDLLQSGLVENPHALSVVVKPVAGLEDSVNATHKKELADLKSTWSAARIKDVVEQTRRLKELQAKPDSPEDVAKIPMLSLADLDRTIRTFPVHERTLQGRKLIHVDEPTQGIIYLDLLFDASVLPQEMLPQASLLSGVLSELGTKNHDYGALTTELNIHTGGVDFQISTYPRQDDPNRFQPTFKVSTKVLAPKLDTLLGLLAEILTSTRYNERARFEEVLQMRGANAMGMLRNAGVNMAMQRLGSYLSPLGQFGEQTQGLTFARFVLAQAGADEKARDALAADLAFLADLVFARDNLTFAVTCPTDALPAVEASLATFLSALPTKTKKSQTWTFADPVKNEGLLSASKVQYVSRGGNFLKSGHAYEGRMEVLSNVLSLDYLIQKVRVEGGAYGAWAGFERTGFAYFQSYRDPELKKTLEVYDHVVDYLAAFAPSQEDMVRYVIGTISKQDQPLTPSMKGRRALAYYLRGIDDATRQRERDEILAATPEHIRGFAPLIKDVLAQEIWCVFGGEEMLNKEQQLFSRLIKTIE